MRLRKYPYLQNIFHKALGKSTWGGRLGILHFIFITCMYTTTVETGRYFIFITCIQQLQKLDVLPDILDVSYPFITFYARTEISDPSCCQV